MHITKNKSEYRMTEEKSHNLGEFRKKHNLNVYVSDYTLEMEGKCGLYLRI